MKSTTASGIPVHCAHARLADVTTLVANPRNPNKHGDAQVALLAKIIRHQGWRAPITISKRSGFIVTGHGRLQAALLLQVEKVPVDEQDFATEADEWAHLVADNKISELAKTDYEALSEILHEMKAIPDFDLGLLGMEDHDLEVLLAADWKPPAKESLESSEQPAQAHGMKSIQVTEEQHDIIIRAVQKLRTDEDDKEASEGRCLELICANFLA